MTNYDITIVSDIVCPWCYVGHTRLTKAITSHKATFPSDTFTLTYQPFYLQPPSATSTSAPPFPVKSVPHTELLAGKYGATRARQMNDMLAQIGRAEGIEFRTDRMTGSSRNGHRLVHYAQTHGGVEAQNEVMLGLWRRFFEQAVDITELETLVSVGVEAGLGTEKEVREFLESGRATREVDELAERAREDGVNGVPQYTVQGEWVVNGAQEPAAFEALFKRWKAREEKGDGAGISAKVGGVKGDGC